jgi:hypothetical protein
VNLDYFEIFDGYAITAHGRARAEPCARASIPRPGRAGRAGAAGHDALTMAYTAEQYVADQLRAQAPDGKWDDQIDRAAELARIMVRAGIDKSGQYGLAAQIDFPGPASNKIFYFIIGTYRYEFPIRNGNRLGTGCIAHGDNVPVQQNQVGFACRECGCYRKSGQGSEELPARLGDGVVKHFGGVERLHPVTIRCIPNSNIRFTPGTTKGFPTLGNSIILLS